MPAPLLLVALKVSASAGFAFGVVDYVSQVVRKKVVPPKGKCRPISSKEMMKAFAVGVVVGNLVCTPLYVHLFLHKTRFAAVMKKALPAILECEAVFFPLHAALISGCSSRIDGQLPIVFGKAAFTAAGGFLVCDIVIRTHLFSPTTLIAVKHVARAIRDVGGTVVSFLLFSFCNKYADYQMNKTIKDGCPTVDTIQAASTWVGQAFGNWCSFALAATPWLPGAMSGASWYYGAVIIAPGFFYCTALNIEAGVKCQEVEGRGPLDRPGRVDLQKRSSILQTLPLGALPASLAKGRKLGTGVIIGTKFLAAACAALYIAYQQEVWGKFVENEKDMYGGKMFDELQAEEVQETELKKVSDNCEESLQER